MSYILSFIVAFGVTFIAGQILVPLLRKWKAGQSIREDGPTWHMSKPVSYTHLTLPTNREV